MSVVHCGLVVLFGMLSQPETRFVQVHPKHDDSTSFERSADQQRAIVLINGLELHPFSNEKAKQARLRDWQQADSTLVRALVQDSDVFSFAYSQNVPVNEVAESAGLNDAVERLRQLRYSEIVLIGHSAGGLVARQFVEDHSNTGVSKVIQLCAPNNGSSWVVDDRVVRNEQEPFLKSLSIPARVEFLKTRQETRIPAHVQFVCVVGDCGTKGDGVVSYDSQWPEDLRSHGIPAVRVNTTHFSSVRSSRVAEILAGLVREKQPRWDDEKVAEMKKSIFGK